MCTKSAAALTMAPEVNLRRAERSLTLFRKSRTAARSSGGADSCKRNGDSSKPPGFLILTTDHDFVELDVVDGTVKGGSIFAH